MVTGVDAVTLLVEIANVAPVAPCATATLAGTLAAAPLLASDTDVPPAGAAPLNVTVPCDDEPPVTVAGLTDIAETLAVDVVESGSTVS
jgi:hypothetical protein